MTLLTEIQAACTPAEIASRDHSLIAAKVSVGRTRLQKTTIGEGTIIDTLGLTVANSFLDVIDSVADYRHVKKIIARGDFDVASPTAQAGIQAMVPAVLTQAQADSLKNLAVVPNPVSEYDVAITIERGV